MSEENLFLEADGDTHHGGAIPHDSTQSHMQGSSLHKTAFAWNFPASNLCE